MQRDPFADLNSCRGTVKRYASPLDPRRLPRRHRPRLCSRAALCYIYVTYEKR